MAFFQMASSISSAFIRLEIDARVLCRIDRVDALDLGGVGVDIPFVGRDLDRQEARRQIVKQVLCNAVLAEQIFAMLGLEHQLPTQAVDGLTLAVHHVVVFENVFACFKVAGLDGLLGTLDLSRNGLRFDRDALFHAEPFHHRADLVARKDAHQVVFEREDKSRRSRIALTAGTAAKLIIDTPRFVTLGAEDVQAAGGDDFFVLFGDDGLRLFQAALRTARALPRPG